jgi:hypothetical protein
MHITHTLFSILTLTLLVVSLFGVMMGINRTMRSRENESGPLQGLAAFMGVILIVFSIFVLFQGSVVNSSIGYTVLIMMVLGLSLCARQLEKIHVTLVLALILGLGTVWAIGHFGMPKTDVAVLQKENVRNLLVMVGIIALGAIVLMIFTVEKIIDLFLSILGLGPIVIVLSGIGVAHAFIILFSGNNHGVMRYFHFLR